MVNLLFCGMSLVEKVSEDFDVSDNPFCTCFVEEATYPSSCVIFIFQPSLYYLPRLLCMK